MSKYNIIRSIKIIIRKAKFFAVMGYMTCLLFSSATAQSKFAKKVDMPRFENMSLREVFGVLKEEQSVLFSYNSSLLDLDKQVTVERYQGFLMDYLERLLGGQYSFKETVSHIIINYAPQRMDVLTMDLDTGSSNRMMVSGYVKDIRTRQPIGFVSVYDRTSFQTSTLTAKNGYFELDIKKPESTVSIGLSKENYRDTMLVLLLPVDIVYAAKGRKMGYYHIADSTKSISHSWLGNLFTNSRQRMQNLNLGGFFVYSPFQISMTPGLSTQGFFNSQVVNKISLNLLGGYTAGVKGLELAGGFNINQFHMQGTQAAGLFNVVGGDVKGVQLAGGANITLNRLTGVQAAGLSNRVDTIVSGVQVAGGINVANDAAHGIQVAGLVNRSGGEVRSQLAGAINIAKKVHGVQVAGLINIADSSDYPIAVFNWIKKGSRSLSVGVDESDFASLTFRSGGRVMYSVLGVGTYLRDEGYKYGFETGIGAHLLDRKPFALGVEIVQRMHMDRNFRYMETDQASVRFIPSVYLGRHLQVYVAPSVTYSEAIDPVAGHRKLVWKYWGADRTRNTLHAGGTFGLTYVF